MSSWAASKRINFHKTLKGGWDLKVSKRFRWFCYLPQHTREIDWIWLDNLNILTLVCQSSSKSLSIGIDVLGLRISAYDRQVYRRVKSWHGNRCLRHCRLHGVSKLSLRPCMSWTSKDAGNHRKDTEFWCIFQVHQAWHPDHCHWTGNHPSHSNHKTRWSRIWECIVGCHWVLGIIRFYDVFCCICRFSDMYTWCTSL